MVYSIKTYPKLKSSPDRAGAGEPRVNRMPFSWVFESHRLRETESKDSLVTLLDDALSWFYRAKDFPKGIVYITNSMRFERLMGKHLP